MKIPGVGFVISINLKQCLDKIVWDDINFYKFNTKVIALETKKWNRFCYSVPNRIQSTKKQNLNPDSITLFCVGLVWFFFLIEVLKTELKSCAKTYIESISRNYFCKNNHFYKQICANFCIVNVVKTNFSAWFRSGQPWKTDIILVHPFTLNLSIMWNLADYQLLNSE